MDGKAVRDAFARFAYAANLDAAQMNFVEKILEYFTRNGYLEKQALYEQPFTDIHYQSLAGLFKPDEVDNLMEIIDTVNGNVVGF